MEERSKYWKGRVTKPELGPLYYYQIIKLIDDVSTIQPDSIVLNGYSIDEGVRLNLGRVGAVNGPDAIRSQLSTCALQDVSLHIYDLGDIKSLNPDVLTTQERLADRTYNILKRGSIPINLGGGHDISYGSGLGLFRAFQGKKIGTINFDAHLDLRNTKQGANSGTPFFQISQLGDSFHYLALGIQNEANTLDLFNVAKDLQVEIVFDEEMTVSNFKEVEVIVEDFLKDKDVIHLSIDMDVFPFASSPGVSAINPVGVEPKLILKLIEKIVISGKVKVVDIAEVNPDYDIDQITAKLAARIIAKIANLII